MLNAAGLSKSRAFSSQEISPRMTQLEGEMCALTLQANELLRDIFNLGMAEADDCSEESGRYSRAPSTATQKRRSVNRGRQQSQKATRASWGMGASEYDEGY